MKSIARNIVPPSLWRLASHAKHRLTATKELPDELRPVPTIYEYQQLFEAHGGTDVGYLLHHFPRYVDAKRRLRSSWGEPVRGKRLLDIGAHWLHQSLLYALDGYEVTALDTPATFEDERVRSLAEAYRIRLLVNDDLEQPKALAKIPDNSFDLVLFTEVIEHLTFNPIAMWREIYRVMRQGGRIVITTPNYYAWRGRTWHWGTFFALFGGGANPIDILSLHSYALHWKEYSLRELIYYFCVLSPDFSCVNRAHVKEYSPDYLPTRANVLTRWLENSIPILRPDLYLEIELRRKEKGIAIAPHW